MFIHPVNRSVRLAYAFGLLSLAVSTCSATPTNVTIDDQTGDAISGLLPNYSPSIAWNQGAGCDFCAAKPNASDAGGGTWHDASYNPGVYPEQFGVTLQFNGIFSRQAYTLLPYESLLDCGIGRHSNLDV